MGWDRDAPYMTCGEWQDKYEPELAAKDAEIERLEGIVADRFEVKLRMAEEIERLRAALEEVYQSVKPLLPDGWSDAGHVMNVIARALQPKEGEKE